MRFDNMGRRKFKKMIQKNNKDIDFSKMILGKIPPHAKEMEDSVLGIMLLEPSKVIIVKEYLSEFDFYSESNQIICSAIFNISKKNIADLVLVADYLVQTEQIETIGGAYELVKLTNKVTDSSNIQRYCTIIKEKSLKRRLVNFGSIILNKAVEESEDLFDVLTEAEMGLNGINIELGEMNITPISNIAMGVIDKLGNRAYKAKHNIKDDSLIYTGIKAWDKINGSLFPGLYIIAGRPGMGKGNHMTELICRMGVDYHIGVINAEMTNEQLLTRIGCNLKGIDNFLFKKDPSQITEADMEIVQAAMEEALNLKLHIDGNRNIQKISNKIKLWVEKYDVKCIMIDFLTILKVPPELERYYTKTQQVDYILDVLTQQCKDLSVPIFLYVQMNREILGRAGTKEPNLADLKQSGSIEELAYQVSFLHRPEYYDSDAVTDEMGESTKGLCYQIIAKHREGQLGRIKLKANLACSQMKDWEDNARFSFVQSDILDTPF